jgi:hypothetical protein
MMMRLLLVRRRRWMEQYLLSNNNNAQIRPHQQPELPAATNATHHKVVV